jgi:hypothetical protein
LRHLRKLLLKYFCGLLGGKYFLHPVGDVPLVIDNLESVIVAFPHFPVGQYGEAIAIVTNNQIIREAIV